MQWIIARIKWIMLVSGVLTCTMLYAAIAPQAALRATFGPTLEGPVAEIVVRNWGALIALVGALLIYGAFNPPSRRLVLAIAVISKLIFMLLVVTYGRAYLGKAGIALAVDLISVGLFAAYLFSGR
ncbi:MAG TPA: hypothetical protein VD886_21730, partial [Herpetosiphonaceae bacterium]|nr:hypothetical protein [Herpetosiphonaceae bacterium]